MIGHEIGTRLKDKERMNKIQSKVTLAPSDMIAIIGTILMSASLAVILFLLIRFSVEVFP